MGKRTKQKKWNIEVVGFANVAKTLIELEGAAEIVLDSATKKAIEYAKDDAVTRCPVKTGALRRSLDIKKEKTKKVGKEGYQLYSKGVTKGGVRYAFAVENGTSKMAAQPFMRPSIDNNRDKLENIIKEELVKGMEMVK